MNCGHARIAFRAARVGNMQPGGELIEAGGGWMGARWGPNPLALQHYIYRSEGEFCLIQGWRGGYDAGLEAPLRFSGEPAFSCAYFSD